MTHWTPVVLAFFAIAAPASAQTPAVVDGDTLVLNGERIRLWGVDAPEGRQDCYDAKGGAYRCGDMARDRLRALIGNQAITCKVHDRDAYGRAVAQCRAGGVDVGEAMVRSGWAVEYRQFSRGAYAAAEAEAKAARRGIWAGRFEQPSEWRADQRTTPPQRTELAAPPKADCVVKGNINTKGRRIFHVPGQQDYAGTRIDPAQGERWFCSAEEARAAGWTPAQR